MLVACIDIGSNTTRLLVAEAGDGTLREVLQERAFTRLGGKGEISRDKIASTAEAVARQVELARECGAECIRTVGTHAIRQAVNRRELLSAIEGTCGVRVDVLSGDDEARLAFAGATKTLPDVPAGQVGVVDVGGGSTELVCGTLAEGVAWSESFRCGSGFLADAYLRSDPPTAAELQRVRLHAAGLFEGLDAPRPDVAYAVGGSATSLRRLVGPVLDEASLDNAVETLASAPAAEVAERFDLHAERVRLLPAGILLLREAARVLRVPLEISCGGLREGVVLEELARAEARAA